MLLTFVNETDRDRVTAWRYASYDGQARAIGIVYSPISGDKAVVVIDRHFDIDEPSHDALHDIIFNRDEDANFSFTTPGCFTIEVDEKKLRECIRKGDDDIVLCTRGG